MNVVLMNTEEALRLWVVTKQKTTTEIIRCSGSGFVSSEQSTITLQPFEVVVQMKHLKRIFFCLLSHISIFFFFVEKVSWDTGNKWIFLQTERGVGGWWWGSGRNSQPQQLVPLWREELAFTLFYFFFLQSSTACRSCGCRHRQFGNFTGPHITFSGMSVSSHPWTPCTRARHRCRQEKALQQVIGHHQLKKKKNRNSTVWTLAHTNSQHDNTYQPMQN